MLHQIARLACVANRSSNGIIRTRLATGYRSLQRTLATKDTVPPSQRPAHQNVAEATPDRGAQGNPLAYAKPIGLAVGVVLICFLAYRLTFGAAHGAQRKGEELRMKAGDKLDDVRQGWKEGGHDRDSRR